jgi:cobalt/nickel transport system ATP-binding protein
MIQIDNLSLTYPDRTAAVSGVALHIREGEHVALAGANGAGKTSLLLSLVGVLLPSDGSIIIDDIAVTKKSLPDIRRRAGMVFQNPDDQLFMPTVYEDIAFGLRNSGLSEEETGRRVTEIAGQLGIGALLEKSPSHLSGGEKRTVALAGVFVMQPSVLLADEPSSFLDPRARRSLIALLRSLRITLVVATHDLDLALSVCPRTVLLKNGSIAADGVTADILRNEELLLECGL